MSRSFLDRAAPFLGQGILTTADVYAVALAAPRFGETDPERLLGLAFAVRAPRLGHAGVDLGRVEGRIDAERLLSPAPNLRAPLASTELDEDGEAGDTSASLLVPAWPSAAHWQAAVARSPMVGDPEDAERPFVLQRLGEGTLLLTRRMYREQARVAEALRARQAQALPDAAKLRDLDARLHRLFGGDVSSEAARAVRLAAQSCLALVIGGPGTGKTFSITRLLAALLAERAGDAPLVVALAAPTGKAAVRMREAIREATAANASPPLDVDEGVRTALQHLEAKTLHRLLGVRPDGSARHHAKNPVPADVVVVDEVSMVDLTQMRRLLEAVRPEARLVLLGDRDQLASVEAGCVLADLVGDASTGLLADKMQVFTRSHRFASAPDVSLIAGCLQSYDVVSPDIPAEPAARAALAQQVFAGERHAHNETHPRARVRWLGPPERGSDGGTPRPTDTQLEALARPYTEGYERLSQNGNEPIPGYAALLKSHLRPSGDYDPALLRPEVQSELLGALERYRVLAVHRRGPLGVAGLEAAIARRVRAYLGFAGPMDSRRHWLGRPLLITENAYDVGLMNGDVGLVLPTLQGDCAVFPHERAGELRAVALSRLPAHEGALAMTVHKAQGSQFDCVALVLAGRASPLETRELVYTGVTRAQNQLRWLGDLRELAEALERRVDRASGLGALLG